jgi:hypothetical protein
MAANLPINELENVPFRVKGINDIFFALYAKEKIININKTL